jgi:serine protease Do
LFNRIKTIAHHPCVKKIFISFSIVLLTSSCSCVLSTNSTISALKQNTPFNPPTTFTVTTAPNNIQTSPSITPGSSENTRALNSITEVINMVGSSVVMVVTEGVDWANYLEPVPVQGAGSGVIINSDGYIVTNNHVIEGAKSVKVYLSDTRVLDATIQGVDAFSDLAVIKIYAPELKVAIWGDSTKLTIGQPVIAIGNAFVLSGGYTVTSGIVSALGRSIQIGNKPIIHNLIQTDAAINPGNSGGPLVTFDGKVVGINTAMIGDAENIGFSVSSAVAESVTNQLIKHGRILWPWLGIDVLTITPLIAEELNLNQVNGVVIIKVFNDSPGAKIGLEEKDILLAIAGNNIKSVTDLQEELQKHRIGEEIQLTYLRGGQTTKTVIKLEQPPNHF